MRILFVNALLFCSIVYADFFYISYKYVVKDFRLYNENLLVSKAMQPCSGLSSDFIILKNDKNDTFTTLIQHKQEKIVTFLNTLGLHIQSQDTFHQRLSHTDITVTFFTQCFKVDFNDSFVKISALK